MDTEPKDNAIPTTREIKERCMEMLVLSHRSGWNGQVGSWGHYSLAWDRRLMDGWDAPARKIANARAQPVVEVLFADSGNLRVVKFICEDAHVARLLYAACLEIKRVEGWIAAAELYNKRGESCDFTG